MDSFLSFPSFNSCIKRVRSTVACQRLEILASKSIMSSSACFSVILIMALLSFLFYFLHETPLKNLCGVRGRVELQLSHDVLHSTGQRVGSGYAVARPGS